MASGVSVERTALQSGIGVCKTCIHELADASRTLKRDYQSAGSGWKDQQYSVPREMLPDSISMEQIKQVMKKCILSETDNLFELLRVTINDDYLY